MSYDILIVDDQEDIRLTLSNILQDEGYNPRQATNGPEALEQVKIRRPHLIILDIWFNDNRLDGLQTLDLLKQLHPHVPVVMISGHGNIETAVSALKKGAYDFIEKPFKTDRLLNIIQRGLELSQLQREIQMLQQEVDRVQELTGASSHIVTLRQSVERVGKTNSRIMIEGPAGVGKEVLARLIHQNSYRASHPFVVVNCTNLLPARFEEELFGTEKRTGPLQTDLKLGLLEKADGGTLFLDGIGEMPLETQGKILQVLQDQSFYRVGGTKPIQVDVRVISATTNSLSDTIKKGLFREDLYYRLNVVPLSILPLSQRREDITLLAQHFINKFYTALGKETVQLTEEAKLVLETYAWPGNVRQLRNTMEWLSILHPEAIEITAEMMPVELKNLPSEQQMAMNPNTLLSLQIKQAREEFERTYLELHIKRFNGNISKTAEAVGMERTALHRKIKMLNLA